MKCPGGKFPSRFYLGDLGGNVRKGSVRVSFFIGGVCPGGNYPGGTVSAGKLSGGNFPGRNLRVARINNTGSIVSYRHF